MDDEATRKGGGKPAEDQEDARDVPAAGGKGGRLPEEDADANRVDVGGRVARVHAPGTEEGRGGGA